VAIRIDLLTLFPAMADGFLRESVIGRAIEKGTLGFKAHDLRQYSKDKHRKVDDIPYGGGPGMLMTCQPLFDAVDALATPDCEVIYLCPDGEQLTNPLARELAQKSHLILISGHYEGIDQRFRERKVTREISIGDYVLTNGTLPACVLVDCIGRQIPGVLGEENSLTGDSYNGKLLAFPQYTRPAVYDGLEVPPVLLGGHHAEIEKWRRVKQIEKTKHRRPDLLEDQEHQP
jgi:tRNA (guanine37-N1)-methyltransferase